MGGGRPTKSRFAREDPDTVLQVVCIRSLPVLSYTITSGPPGHMRPSFESTYTPSRERRSTTSVKGRKFRSVLCFVSANAVFRSFSVADPVAKFRLFCSSSSVKIEPTSFVAATLTAVTPFLKVFFSPPKKSPPFSSMSSPSSLARCLRSLSSACFFAMTKSLWNSPSFHLCAEVRFESSVFGLLCPLRTNFETLPSFLTACRTSVNGALLVTDSKNGSFAVSGTSLGDRTPEGSSIPDLAGVFETRVDTALKGVRKPKAASINLMSKFSGSFSYFVKKASATSEEVKRPEIDSITSPLSLPSSSERKVWPAWTVFQISASLNSRVSSRSHPSLALFRTSSKNSTQASTTRPARSRPKGVRTEIASEVMSLHPKLEKALQPGTQSEIHTAPGPSTSSALLLMNPTGFR
mmetsp:Transcript_24518/g.48078  ORF Transcript_24518/g.48078 Transcript_24518/m.48078 type:complete len:408 (-) Transcript_24518:1413-2636(-)